MCRSIEDYAVVYFGSAIFKMARLLIIATSCVHLFACAFHRVKVESAYSPEEVTAFYSSRGIEDTVNSPIASVILSQRNKNLFYAKKRTIMPFSIAYWFVPRSQDLGGQYVRSRRIFNLLDLEILFHFVRLIFQQLVCFYYVLTTFTTVGYGESSCNVSDLS
jgi:hypothetical protein